MKDLGRFLYSLVTLDHPIDSRLLESVFVPCFLKLQTKTFNQHELNPSYARNCLISFWYMGYDLERIGDVCKSAAENIESKSKKRILWYCSLGAIEVKLVCEHLRGRGSWKYLFFADLAWEVDWCIFTNKKHLVSRNEFSLFLTSSFLRVLT